MIPSNINMIIIEEGLYFTIRHAVSLRNSKEICKQRLSNVIFLR